MQTDLGDIDKQPGNPAIPFLHCGQELGHEDEHSHAGIQVRHRIGRKDSDAPFIAEHIEQPSPQGSKDENRQDCQYALRPGEHSDFQGGVVLGALFPFAWMSPPVMAYNIDYKGNRLKKQARVQMLVPEHQEKQEGIDIAHIEIIFAVAPCKEDASESKTGCEQVYEQHRSVAAACK